MAPLFGGFATVIWHQDGTTCIIWHHDDNLPIIWHRKVKLRGKVGWVLIVRGNLDHFFSDKGWTVKLIYSQTKLALWEGGRIVSDFTTQL